jgi:hypothetical protein
MAYVLLHILATGSKCVTLLFIAGRYTLPVSMGGGGGGGEGHTPANWNLAEVTRRHKFRILDAISRHTASTATRYVPSRRSVLCQEMELQYISALMLPQMGMRGGTSGPSVRQRNIPTERPPLVDEFSANFSR